MKELSIINRLEYHRDVFKKSSVTYQDMQDAINCIIGLKAENEALKQRLELLSEMEKEKCASYMAITETPTAFDIEAVVKELEGLKAEYKEGWDEGNHEDDYGAYFAIENAIEIVRKGGVK